MTEFDEVAGIGQPARQALIAHGYPNLESLNGAKYQDLLSLHGIGKRGLERVQSALLAQGLSLSGEIPESIEGVSTAGASTAGASTAGVSTEGANQWTIGHTGQQSKDIKTHAGTDEELEEYLSALEGRRAPNAKLLLDIFARATGDKPRLWGPSMIGYGEAHYKYATGREGDTFRVGFAPRKAKISLYGIQESPRWKELSAQLGKYTTGASCVYVNKLEDIDLEVLESLIRESWEHGPHSC